jgi:hypothetical protein
MDGTPNLPSSRAPVLYILSHLPGAMVVLMQLGSLDEIHSLNLGTTSASFIRKELMVRVHGIDKRGVAETSRKRKAIPIQRA